MITYFYRDKQPNGTTVEVPEIFEEKRRISEKFGDSAAPVAVPAAAALLLYINESPNPPAMLERME